MGNGFDLVVDRVYSVVVLTALYKNSILIQECKKTLTKSEDFESKYFTNFNVSWSVFGLQMAQI